MWKMLVAFIVFAAIALTVVFKMGDKADMSGEAGGHDTEQHSSTPATPAAPAAAAPAATPVADEKK